MPKITVGRSEDDKDKHGLDGTGVIGKHLVGEDEEAHTANPLHFDLAKPHVIGVFGKRGTGKCLMPDEKVLTEDGIERIDNIFNQGREKGAPEIQKEDEQLYTFEGKQVQSVQETYSTTKNQIKAAYRKKVDEKLLKIRTKSGREITVTKEHPLFTHDGWENADHLEVGEKLGVPRKLDLNFKDKSLKVPEDFTEAKYSTLNVRESELLEAGGGSIRKLSDGTGSYSRMLKNAESQQLISVKDNSVEITEKGAQELEKRKTTKHYRIGKSRPIKAPDRVTPELGEFLAYLIAEGHEQKITENNYRLMFTNNNQRLIDRFKELGETLFDLKLKKMDQSTLYANSRPLEMFLDANGYETSQTSFEKEIPNFILSGSDETAVQFLQTYYDCEANVTNQQIELSTASKEIANSINYMLLRFGIVGRISQKKKYAANTEEQTVRTYQQVTISGSENLERFNNKIDFSIERKSNQLSSIIKESNTNVDTISCGETIRQCREDIGAYRTQIVKHKQSLKAYEDGKYDISREKLRGLIEQLQSHITYVEDLEDEVDRNPDVEIIEELVDASNLTWKDVNEAMGYSGSDKRILTYKKFKLEPERLATEVIELFEDSHEVESAKESLDELKRLADSDVFWDEVEQIMEIDYDGWVYDLTVENDHSFTGGFGGILCHNSYSMGTIVEELQDVDISDNISTIMIDPMGIFWSMKRPNERDVSILDRWDMKPKAFDAQVYIPKGKTKDFDEMEMPYDDTFTLNPAELTSEEWRMAFDLNQNSEMSILLERMIHDLTEEFGEDYRIKHIKQATEKYEFPSKVKRGLENRLTNAEDWGIFGEESSIDKLTAAGELSVVDVSVFGQLSGGTRVQALVVSILAKRILRRRMAARRLEELDEMQGLDRSDEPIQWMLIDEAHEYLPAHGETPATNPLLRWVKIGREPGVSLVLCTQQPAKLHPNALSQMDVLLAHRLTAQQDIDALKEIMQTYMRYSLKHYINALPDRPGTAMIMDDNSERAYPAQMRPRKSWHAGGTPDAFDD